ncbi:hypothetical protein ACFX58_09780 [Sphingomonas sp. NCPPB 2930]
MLLGSSDGFYRTPKIHYDKTTLTGRPFYYVGPATGDIPAHFQVELWHEPNREDNVFGSKAVGEPPFMLAISVYEALRNAVAAARPGDGPVRLEAPATPENLLRALGGL